jgi:2-polyprenyl-3-methyl-5-hydroxy-6-metoxy-1,4-benzoquinol methylase
VLAAVPFGARSALDVGCGEGMLTRELASIVPQVHGIDLDVPSIELARKYGGDNITYVVGDVLSARLPTYDVVASVATLHHMDTVAGLTRLRDLVAPGGVLAVIGLARSRLPRDLGWQLAGAVSTRAIKLRRTYWEHSAPTCWPPPETFDGMRRIAEDVLPGVRYRRHVLWRYSLVWRAPA